MIFDIYFRELIKIINRVQKTFHTKLHGIIRGKNIKVCPQKKNYNFEEMVSVATRCFSTNPKTDY